MARQPHPRTHMHALTHARTHMHTYAHTHMHTYMHTHTHARTHAHPHARTHAHLISDSYCGILDLSSEHNKVVGWAEQVLLDVVNLDKSVSNDHQVRGRARHPETLGGGVGGNENDLLAMLYIHVHGPRRN